MKFKFKIQDYQTDAVESVVSVFSGQPNEGMAEYVMDKGKVYIKDGNRLVEQTDFNEETLGYKNADIRLTDNELLDNIRKAQAERNIRQSESLVGHLGRCSLDIEMETGTGKTYVYVKTMLELNKRYGWTKFIVVVPSIAIREGVKKSFDITADHFMEHYGKKVRYFVYNSSELPLINDYSTSSEVNVMIINTQAFNTSLREGANNKAARIIYTEQDGFGSRKPIDVISANRPIIILDEPQKMGGDATQAALKRFRPLFTLNYSATHKQSHNPVYVLDALDAYNKRLVKKIEVVGFELRNLKGTDKYVFLDSILVSQTKAPQARMTFEVKQASGTIKRKTMLLGKGSDLYYLSNNLLEYKGYVISDIKPMENKVEFANGITIAINEAIGDVSADQKARIQIRQTINAHLKKERELYRKGIKTISLFFLDEVANYRLYDESGNQQLGKYGQMFEEEYMEAVNENLDMYEPEYADYLKGIAVGTTHAGYFSIDPKSKRAVNSVTKGKSDTSDDISAYELILKNKERLLSFDEPVRFIFSHSALREGWDNPNVFQICSLKQSNSTTQKRQEVGRGLRLCVDKNGVRMDKDILGDRVQDINKLTVVASEAYASFVGDLQSEIKENLYDRPTKVDIKFFVDREIKVDGTKHKITFDEAQEIFLQLRNSGYIAKDGKVTDSFRSDAKDKTLKPLPEELEPMSKGVFALVQSVYDDSALKEMIDDGGKPEITENKLNDNFYSKEFKELWQKINHMYAYTVKFDSQELIDKAVTAIDAELNVSKLTYVVTIGEQKADLTKAEYDSGETFVSEKTRTDVLRQATTTNVKYDLVGQIARGTVLTRKTVATILSKIRPTKFDMYQANPEEFISKVTRMIMEQKAALTVEHISYNRIEGIYDSNIFTDEARRDFSKAFMAKKSVLPYVFLDSKNENKFISDLEIADEVAVYAKLPKGFHIPTPVGNYSPDWAIAFRQGSVKHVFFVAETKGSMSSMELRDIEKNKISCAKKLFESISDEGVVYHEVTDYQKLLELVK